MTSTSPSSGCVDLLALDGVGGARLWELSGCSRATGLLWGAVRGFGRRGRGARWTGLAELVAGGGAVLGHAVGGFGDAELDGLALAFAYDLELDGLAHVGVQGEALQLTVVLDRNAFERHHDVVLLQAGRRRGAAGIDARDDGAARLA